MNKRVMLERIRANRKRVQIDRINKNINEVDNLEDELKDKFKLWILRVLFDLNGFDNFIKSNEINRQQYFKLFDINYLYNIDKIESLEVYENLYNQKIQLENKKNNLKTNKTFNTNINHLANILKLNKYEKDILEYLVLSKSYEILNNSHLFVSLYPEQENLIYVLSKAVNVPQNIVKEILSNDSVLIKTGIIEIGYWGRIDNILDLIDFRNKDLLNNIVQSSNGIDNFIEKKIKKVDESTLTLKDYDHIKKEIDILVPFLKNAIEKKEKGVNIILYGVPGTGKTELTKTLSKVLKINLYEVSYKDKNSKQLNGNERQDAYLFAQALLSNEKNLLMYDEAEDIFGYGNSPFFRAISTNKAWINSNLETNDAPTIWITNNPKIDKSTLRRFSFALELPIPPKDKREKILKKYCNSTISNKAIKKLSEYEYIAPALIKSSIEIVKTSKVKNRDRAFVTVLNNSLKVQGYKEIELKENKKIDEFLEYNPAYVNCDFDLDKIVQGIKNYNSARLCLYGVSGTGKSAYGKYIAKILNKKYIIKKGSDILSMWVGNSEKNIANAFKEATKKDAVLIFDEIDSFLQERSKLDKQWQITMVNEMLVQMENFDGVFITTTNLIDTIDKASLRRFDLKIKFDYLNKQQRWSMFKDFANIIDLKVDDVYKEKIDNLYKLTPGDLVAVLRQNRFNTIIDVDDFIKRLKNEIKVKDI